MNDYKSATSSSCGGSAGFTSAGSAHGDRAASNSTILHQTRGPGFVFVMGNMAMPGIFSVHSTPDSPTAYARELSQSVAVPLPFEVLCFGEVEDPVAVERDILKRYSRLLLNCDRQFLAARFSLLATAVDMASMNYHMTPAGESVLNAEPTHEVASVKVLNLVHEAESASWVPN